MHLQNAAVNFHITPINITHPTVTSKLKNYFQKKDSQHFRVNPASAHVPVEHSNPFKIILPCGCYLEQLSQKKR